MIFKSVPQVETVYKYGYAEGLPIPALEAVGEKVNAAEPPTFSQQGEAVGKRRGRKTRAKVATVDEADAEGEAGSESENEEPAAMPDPAGRKRKKATTKTDDKQPTQPERPAEPPAKRQRPTKKDGGGPETAEAKAKPTKAKPAKPDATQPSATGQSAAEAPKKRQRTNTPKEKTNEDNAKEPKTRSKAKDTKPDTSESKTKPKPVDSDGDLDEIMKSLTDPYKPPAHITASHVYSNAYRRSSKTKSKEDSKADAQLASRIFQKYGLVSPDHTGTFRDQPRSSRKDAAREKPAPDAEAAAEKPPASG